MVEHNQTICWLLLMDCLSVFDRFVGLAHKGLIFLLLYIMLDLYLYFFVMFIFTFTLMENLFIVRFFSEINKLLTYSAMGTQLLYGARLWIAHKAIQSRAPYSVAHSGYNNYPEPSFTEPYFSLHSGLHFCTISKYNFLLFEPIVNMARLTAWI